MKEKLLQFINSWEGCILHPYKDIVGINTIYRGHVLLPRDTSDLFVPPYTLEKANEVFWQDIQPMIRDITKMTRVHLSDNQMIALISFVFNVGTGAYQRSQVRMNLNRGDYRTAADKFLLYSHAGGKIVRGLLLRREAEKQLFLET